jgi:hypothetical protein
MKWLMILPTSVGIYMVLKNRALENRAVGNIVVGNIAVV